MSIKHLARSDNLYTSNECVYLIAVRRDDIMDPVKIMECFESSSVRGSSVLSGRGVLTARTQRSRGRLGSRSLWTVTAVKLSAAANV